MNYGMLAIMLILQMLRGPGSKPSIIDVSRCDSLDWVLLITLFIMCTLLTIAGWRMMQIEYEEKEAAGYKFV